MKQYYSIIAVFMIIALIGTGCGNSPETNADSPGEANQLISITQDQVDSESIELGELTTQIFEESVNCNGYIMAPANGMAQISTPISGIVETINCKLGDFVKKGEVLCLLSSNELMVIQQDFAETSAILSRLKTDYERSKTLFNEKIGAEKDFLAIESEYKATTAKYNALKIRLESLRLNITKIEGGELYSAFPVVSPIKGYISDMNIVLGQFAEQQKNLIEIVDVNQLQLQISVFQDDIDKLKTGQNISFSSLGEHALHHYATLISIGKTVNLESKTILCIAKIKNSDGFNFINNSYVEASVTVNDSEAKALPNEAILKSDNDYYVFVVEKSENGVYYLQKVKVNIGRISKGFSEIINGEFDGKVLVKGVYNLQSE